MYTLSKFKDGTIVLQLEGKNLLCPFQNPVAKITPQTLGQPKQEIIYPTCNSNCAHFRLTKAQTVYTLSQTCGNGLPLNDLKLSEESTDEKPTIAISR